MMRVSTYSFGATLLVAATIAGAAKKPVTLDAVIAPPAREHPAIWSPDGTRFLTLTGTKLKSYEVSSRTEKDLADLKELDDQAAAGPAPAAFDWQNRGVQEQEIQWSADGRQILVSRRGDLFLFDLAGGPVMQLSKTPAAEKDPKLAPNGKFVAFRLDHDLHLLDLSSRKTRALTKGGTELVRNAELDWVYPEELQLPTAYWWSPDSRRLAYLQFDLTPVQIYPHGDITTLRPTPEPQRYPQAGTPNPKVRLGLVNATGGATKWITLPELEGGTLIARVDWLPDSSALAVLLLNRVQNQMKWLRVDAKSQTPIVEQTDPAWVNITDGYRFLATTPRLLFTAERPDFRHLYLTDLNGGGKATQITSGNWEVSDIACVDEAAGWVYYTATEASPVERHLYRVKLDGSSKTQLTRGRGTHTISMPEPGCAVFVNSHSSLTEPTRRTLHDAATGKEIAELQPRSTKVIDEFEILPTELTTFRGQDTTLFHARLIKPAGFDPAKKYPAIVQVYGGPHAQSVRDLWRGADFDQYLAHRGFVIWQVDNRGSAGRGHLWESKLYRRFGKQEMEDQVEGVRHLVSLGFVDPSRIGINGWSYGGFMTLYGLFNAPETFAAGIAGAAVTDWRNYDTIYTERYLGLPQQNEDGYKASSPVHQAANLKGKLMLVHNFEDDNVLFQQALRMADALQKADKPFDMMLYPQKAHGVTGSVRRHMLEGMAAFWERNLLR